MMIQCLYFNLSCTYYLFLHSYVLDDKFHLQFLYQSKSLEEVKLIDIDNLIFHSSQAF